MSHEKRRKPIPEMVDHTAALMGVYFLPKFLNERDIQEFCKGCARLNETGICSAGTWHQERAVVQKFGLSNLSCCF